MTGEMKNKFSKKFVFTIFGASGDLADLKLFPALYELYTSGRLENDFWIVGYARSEMSLEEFRIKFKNSILEFIGDKANDFVEVILERVFYFQGQYDKADSFQEYQEFVDEITGGEFEEELFHFSVPPSTYSEIISNIAQIRIGKNRDKVKLLIEKPFGEGADSAEKLERCIMDKFKAEQVFLIDHYLGKHPVRSILSLRENNRVLNMLLAGDIVSNVQISALEKLTVENRLGYYDAVGATRDMVQSHLIQLLCFVLFEMPAKVDFWSVDSTKEYLIRNLDFVKGVFGQYEGYCSESRIACSPNTETYFAGKFFLNNTNWINTPVYLRTGKALDRRQTSVVIEFKKYENQPLEIPCNRLEIEIAPDPSIRLFLVNENGYESKVHNLVTSESLSCEDESCMSPHAVLFLDAMLGKRMFFVSFEQAIESWRLVENVVQNKQISEYQIGANGLKEADELLERDGFKWIDIDE
jgi:glucose-6-phosphate 1-dehydrogenase